MAQSENLLFRSHIEIQRLMQVLAQEKCRISAMLKGEHPFSSYIIGFSAQAERFAVAYSPHKTISAMLMASPEVEFTATDLKGQNFTFTASSPVETIVDGAPAIQFAMPKALLLHNRREHPRLPTATEPALRCVADEAGFIPFESQVTDVSHEGLGCLVYDPEINLQEGSVLHGCRIVIPGGEAVTVDLELRHISPAQMMNGAPVRRAGFRLLKKNGELARLLRVFIQDMDKK